MRHITEIGLNFIKGWEIYKSKPYDDGYGFITWGFGHCRVRNEPIPESISEDDALILLAKDVEKAERAVLRLTKVSLRDEQWDSLVSLTFNAGAGAYQRSKIRMAVNREEFDDVAELFPISFITSRGISSRGLVRRRLAERELFLT